MWSCCDMVSSRRRDSTSEWNNGSSNMTMLGFMLQGTHRLSFGRKESTSWSGLLTHPTQLYGKCSGVDGTVCIFQWQTVQFCGWAESSNTVSMVWHATRVLAHFVSQYEGSHFLKALSNTQVLLALEVHTTISAEGSRNKDDERTISRSKSCSRSQPCLQKLVWEWVGKFAKTLIRKKGTWS